jgi:phage baseplate assembly protein W
MYKLNLEEVLESILKYEPNIKQSKVDFKEKIQ